MRSLAALLIAGVVATCGTACSSSGPTTTLPTSPSTIVGMPATSFSATQTPSTMSVATSTQAKVAATASAFCAEARKIGLRDMSVADGASGANLAAMLTRVDELAALAPAQIRSDFTSFDRFEHAVLGAQKGGPGDMEKLNTPRLAQAMEHVGTYLAGTCGISR